MLVIYMWINQDWEFNLIRFPFWEQSCGIAWNLTCENLGKNLSKRKCIKFYLGYLVNEDVYVDASTLILKITNYH